MSGTSPERHDVAMPELTPVRFLHIEELRRFGLTSRRIRELVEAGELLRVRRGRYLPADTAPIVTSIARLGVRLDCVSLLHHLGVFVLESSRIHVQATNGDSRLPARADSLTCHWRPTSAARQELYADFIEALAQACRCQDPRSAIATLDSAWHLGLVDEAGIAAVFARLPLRYQSLRPLLDRRSESGPESLMRLLLRALGCHVEVQVLIPGVGRVDFLVDGWLIVECDSEKHHSDWQTQKRDKRRDLAAAARGFTTVRPIAEDIMYSRDAVLVELRDALAHGTALRGLRSAARSRRGVIPAR